MENELIDLIDKYGEEDLFVCEHSPGMSMNPTDEKVQDFLEFQLKNGLSKRSTVDLAKMMNKMPAASILMPESKYALKNRVKPLLPFKYFVICKCENLVLDGEMCNLCATQVKKDSKANNFLSYIPILPQIKSVLSTQYNTIIQYFERERNGNLTDIDDAIAFKKIADKYPNVKLLSLTLNIDGAEIFHSSKGSLWLTQIYQNYLPPSMRFLPENILIVTLFYGSNKPNAFQLLSLIAQELEDSEFSIYDGDKIETFVAAIVTSSCDLPARTMLQNFKGPVGKSVCPVCYHPGEAILSLKKRTTIRYVKRDEYPLHTHEETIRKASELTECFIDVDGVKGYSCMLLFNHFDIFDNFAIDFMHGVVLGIAKDIVEIWLGMRKVPDPGNNLKIKFKNSAERQQFNQQFNQRFMQFKPPIHFRRKPRSIFEWKSFKATEILYFLLYYSRFSLRGLLSTSITKHFEKLFVATFQMCHK